MIAALLMTFAVALWLGVNTVPKIQLGNKSNIELDIFLNNYNSICNIDINKAKNMARKKNKI